MGHYRYYFLSLRDEQVIEEIPLFGVFAQRILNGPGQFDASFTLDQTGKNNADLVAATIPGKTWLVIEREGIPVYHGLVWSRTYQSQAKIVSLFGWGFEAFPSRQYMLSDYSDSGGQMAVFGRLWANMQSSALGRNLNVNTNLPIVNDLVTTTVNILATDRKFYGDVMDAIANASDGFDWTIQVTKQNNGIYRKDLVMGYPHLGTTDPSLVTFGYPGSILNYYETEGMSDAGTNIFGFGAGEGADQLVFEASWDDLIAAGYPRWDVGISMKDVSDFLTLQQLTKQEAVTRKPPMNHYTVTIKGDQDPVFGSYGLGDNVYLSIKDPKHPNGFQVQTRIIGWELTPPSADSTEEVKLILPGDDVNGQVPNAAQV